MGMGRDGHLHKQVILQPDIFKSCPLICVFQRIFTSDSSSCIEVIAVDVSMFSYHSFLDCYTVPKFGVLVFQGIIAASSKTTQRNAVSEQKPASF